MRQLHLNVAMPSSSNRVLKKVDLGDRQPIMEPYDAGTMRGIDRKQGSMLMLLSPESRVPTAHPLRAIKKLADAALVELNPTFDAMYSGVGRPSIPPERLLKATLLMAFYSLRSERQFCEQLDYNLLFRWFL